ncbi:glycoside hydrolase family 5 protein [Roseococcus sp.]|uniref:glycoside hydrolase family 5 protein n=1 Tax=Roseococcus sp. TaxID=2109646 RepID=UPI003BAAEFA8
MEESGRAALAGLVREIIGASGVAPPPELTWLRAVGSRLFDENGDRVILRSVAWYSLEQDYYLRGTTRRSYRTRPVLQDDEYAAGGTARGQEGILEELRRLGFNSIRLPISQHITRNDRANGGNFHHSPFVNPDMFRGADTSTHPPSWPDKSGWGSYRQDPPFDAPQPVIGGLEMLDLLIDHCEAIGLRVILDMHVLARHPDNEAGTGGRWYTTPTPSAPGRDTGAIGEPRNERQMIEAWVFLARRYKYRPVVSCFDILNEPFNCTWDPGEAHPRTNIRAFYERCATAVMDVNPRIFLWFQGIHGSAHVDGALRAYDPRPFPELPNRAHIGYFYGSNLEGARTAPVVVRNSAGAVITGQHGYSPHEYAPSVGELNLYNGTIGATPPEVAMVIRWRQLWGWMLEEDLAPVWIGEWSGRFFADLPGMDAVKAARDDAWLATFAEYVNRLGASHSYWCLNADGTRTTGLMLGDDFDGYTGAEPRRMAKIAPMLRG